MKPVSTANTNNNIWFSLCGFQTFYILKPTSFLELLNIVFFAHRVRVPSNVKSIILQDISIAELVELVGRGVQRVPPSVLVVTVVIIENGGFPDGHSNDRAAVLVISSGAPVAVATLRTQQDGGNVVDLVGGLGAGALLGDPTTLAPSVAGVQDKGEEEN